MCLFYVSTVQDSTIFVMVLFKKNTVDYEGILHTPSVYDSGGVWEFW